ncbi:MAG: dihydropteroate synthase [Gammaproteobacteria bacterium]|nr:dihydropteroate synthase [Gammaproteobacteria bacterium]
MSDSILCRDRQLDLSSSVVMGILNITTDSFSDGGELYNGEEPLLDRIVARAEQMMLAGAKILDVGGESTRPGAEHLSIQEELDRVIPVAEVLLENFDIIISVDTSTAEVMKQAASTGVHMINDVRALERQGALETASATKLPVCLMHMKGQPANMQDDPRYEDVVAEVIDYLQTRVQACVAAGMKQDRIIIDPGFGFGKTTLHNLVLLNNLKSFRRLDLPIMVGLSRKRTIGELNDQPVDRRVHGSVAAAVIAVMKGAAIVRVHDVHATVEALKIADAVRGV